MLRPDFLMTKISRSRCLLVIPKVQVSALRVENEDHVFVGRLGPPARIQVAPLGTNQRPPSFPSPALLPSMR